MVRIHDQILKPEILHALLQSLTEDTLLIRARLDLSVQGVVMTKLHWVEEAEPVMPGSLGLRNSSARC